MELLEIVKEAETAAIGIVNGNVQLQILKENGLIKDYQITKTEIIKEWENEQTE
jgi:hypothetical protein